MSEFPKVYATDIGEYIRHESCELRFKLDFNNQEEAKQLPFWERLRNPLDLVLQRSGLAREDEWENQLIKAGAVCIAKGGSYSDDLDSSLEEQQEVTWDNFAAHIGCFSETQLGYGRQIKVAADIGAFHVKGILDFILIMWADGRPRLRIIECKSSRKDQTHHRIQVTLYRMILHHLLRESPFFVCGTELRPDDIECVVARVDATTNSIQDILALAPIDDLTQEEEDIERLLAANGRLMQIVRADPRDLNYQLNEKCNVCKFNICCLPESAIKHCLQLLGLDPSAVRTLHSAGIYNIMQLATLDLKGPLASKIRSDPSFSGNLEMLKTRASARSATLPGVTAECRPYEVQRLQFDRNRSQLPEHVIDGHKLIRVYLCVDYDYVENRLGALTAHITKSDGLVNTSFTRTDNGYRPDPLVNEVWPAPTRSAARANRVRPLKVHNRDIVRIQPTEWTGIYSLDNASEKHLIEAFLLDLANAIADTAGADEAPIHFYVWSRSEIAHLVDACSRADSKLLSHLNELLGCRQGLEQLIYSSVQEEVHNRYAFGWTGRGLVVASALRWFGERYHWVRRIQGSTVDLASVFEQDLFDFKTTLAIKQNNCADGSDTTSIFQWADPNDQDAFKHHFEIRARFYDSLPAPYWRAAWGTLTRPEEIPKGARAKAINRYKRATNPAYLIAYLTARSHALRWIEERIKPKNPQITKPVISMQEIKNFALGVDSIRKAAIDFLQLDQHVRITDWTAAHLEPPLYRVSSGRTIPVKEVSVNEGNLTAKIYLDLYDISYEALKANCSIDEGSFIRLTPCSKDPHSGQTFAQLHQAGTTCTVRSIDWDRREITLDAIPFTNVNNYCLRSVPHYEEGMTFDYATIDESPSDFVALKVEKRLQEDDSAGIYGWLDPTNPAIPQQSTLEKKRADQCRDMLQSFVLPEGNQLDTDQQEACMRGLSTRIHLLQGPPGTGKTNTTAVAVLLRALSRSEGEVFLISATTHTATDNLLERIKKIKPAFEQHASLNGLPTPHICLAKAVLSSNDPVPDGIAVIRSKAPANAIKKLRQSTLLIIGGTPSSLLRMWEKRGKRFDGLVSLLIIDEASMMLFPHFLALATALDPREGEMMLAGDHLQLAPIVAHDWRHEDRPPTVRYRPFISAYDAISDVARHYRVQRSQVYQSALRYTHRLPYEHRLLTGRLYRRDGVELKGRPIEQSGAMHERSVDSWGCVWDGQTGLYLVTHNENQSRLYNEIEASIIERILGANSRVPAGSVAIITPHRAQRTLLKERLVAYTGDLGPVSMIDTVERLQGGQRDTIIVSATESDPAAIGANAEFIFNLERTNVAFTRQFKRLIVICSEHLLDYTPGELETYQSAVLWKWLRTLCSCKISSNTIVVKENDYSVKIFTIGPNELPHRETARGSKQT